MTEAEHLMAAIRSMTDELKKSHSKWKRVRDDKDERIVIFRKNHSHVSDIS